MCLQTIETISVSSPKLEVRIIVPRSNGSKPPLLVDQRGKQATDIRQRKSLVRIFFSTSAGDQRTSNNIHSQRRCLVINAHLSYEMRDGNIENAYHFQNAPHIVHSAPFSRVFKYQATAATFALTRVDGDHVLGERHIFRHWGGRHPRVRRLEHPLVPTIHVRRNRMGHEAAHQCLELLDSISIIYCAT